MRLTFLTTSNTDNLAVSAQGFRRGANRVRKVRISSLPLRLFYLINPFLFRRTCGTFLHEVTPDSNYSIFFSLYKGGKT